MNQEQLQSSLVQGLQSFLHALAQNDRESAMREVEATLAQAPELTGKYCALAASLLQQHGQLDLAARLYEDAVAFDPDDTAARLYLGIALKSLNRETDARLHFAEIASRRPDCPEAHLQHALVQVLDANPDGAYATIESMRSMLPVDSPWQYDAARIAALIAEAPSNGQAAAPADE